jgi:predicted PolB exonuclease-like 3'-5' exonuclease
MKRYLFLLLFVIPLLLNAQKDVTKFLGIPIDGSKEEMRSKLIDKGFTYDKQGDFFTGEFNGSKVNLYVVTYRNKVWRIMVADYNTCSETDIKIRFNNLSIQFANNKKYIKAAGIDDNIYSIPDDEDISYEMKINNKRYEAPYYQIPEAELDTLAIQEKVNDELLKDYTKEQIDNPTDEMSGIIALKKISALLELLSMKSVWFMICEERYGKYYIALYYDNVYNHLVGEDL